MASAMRATTGSIQRKGRRPLPATTPTPRNSAPFRQAVVGGVEADGGRGLRGADDRHDDAHLAQRRIGEQGLGVGLCQAGKRAVEGGEEAEDDEGRAPGAVVEGHEAHEADDAGIDDDATEHGGGRRGSLRVGQRQPDVKRHEPGLHAEADEEAGQRPVAPRAVRQRGLHAGDRQAVGRSGRDDEPGEKRGLAEDRQDDVDAPGAPRGWLAVVDHQSVGSQRHERERHVEGDDVGGHEGAERAGQRHQPEGGERARAGAVGQIGAGVEAGDEPQQGAGAEQDPSRAVDGH
jgi:hypothetical protein